MADKPRTAGLGSMDDPRSTDQKPARELPRPPSAFPPPPPPQLSAGPAGGLVISPATFIIIVFVQAILFALVAIALTTMVTRPDLVMQLAGLQAPAPPSRTVARVEPVLGRSGDAPVALEVPKPIEAVAGWDSYLGLRILPPGQHGGVLLLTLRGLPDGASLGGVRRLSSDTWLLDLSREVSLSLTVPAAGQGRYAVDFELRRPDGLLVASESSTLIARTRGDATPPDADRDVMATLEGARYAVKQGDVKAARVLLRGLVRRGSAQAAFDLAETHDPSAGSVDAASADDIGAIFWYLEAKRLGHPAAQARINAIASRTERKSGQN